jgi:hypothetical protein
MRQSKEAEEVLELQRVTQQLAEDGVIYATNKNTPPFQGGPGMPAKKYTKQQVMQMLDYCKAYIMKGYMDRSQVWLNKLGFGMEEFLRLRDGSPNLDYIEHDAAIETDKGDQYSEGPGPRGKLSWGKTENPKYPSMMGQGPGPGPVTYRSKDVPRDNGVEGISKPENELSWKKSKAGKKVTYTTDY